MRCAATLSLLSLVALAPLARADDVEFKRSLETETPDEGWQGEGFRLSLGYGYGFDDGLANLPDATVHSIVIRVGARLDVDWSVLGSFRYGIAEGELSALTYAITLDPTWHLPAGFELAVGVGFSGLVAASSDQPYPNDYFDEYATDHSITSPDTKHVLDNCSGAGPGALVRLGWQVALDDIWALVLHAEAYARWSLCEEWDGEYEDDGERIVMRQWWGTVGATFGASFAWR